MLRKFPDFSRFSLFFSSKQSSFSKFFVSSLSRRKPCYQKFVSWKIVAKILLQQRLVFPKGLGIYAAYSHGWFRFPRRLNHGGISNNRLLLKNDRLTFSVLFSANFLWGDDVLMEGTRVVMGDSLRPTHWGKPWQEVVNYLRSYLQWAVTENIHPSPLWTTLNWVSKNFRISKKDNCSFCRSQKPADSKSLGIPEFCKTLNGFPGIPVKIYNILGKFMDFQSCSWSISYRISSVVHGVCVDIFWNSPMIFCYIEYVLPSCI